MQELLNSLVKFSAAMTVFSMQQVQTAVGPSSETAKGSLDKFREVIDGMAAAVSSQIDESRRPSVENISKLPQDMLTRAMDSQREVVQSTSDMVKSTSGWIAGMVKATPASSEPQRAEEALAAN